MLICTPPAPDESTHLRHDLHFELRITSPLWNRGGDSLEMMQGPYMRFIVSSNFGFLSLQGWESVTTGAANYLQGWKLQVPPFHQLCTLALCRGPAIYVRKGKGMLCNLCFRYSQICHNHLRSMPPPTIGQAWAYATLGPRYPRAPCCWILGYL